MFAKRDRRLLETGAGKNRLYYRKNLACADGPVCGVAVKEKRYCLRKLLCGGYIRLTRCAEGVCDGAQ